MWKCQTKKLKQSFKNENDKKSDYTECKRRQELDKRHQRIKTTEIQKGQESEYDSMKTKQTWKRHLNCKVTTVSVVGKIAPTTECKRV